VRGITVKNCTLNNTDNGIRIKTYAGSLQAKLQAYFSRTELKKKKNPVIIDQSYGNKDSVRFLLL